jgi:hypothetical protein
MRFKLMKKSKTMIVLLGKSVGGVSCLGWKRSHQIIDGNLYCTVEV